MTRARPNRSGFEQRLLRTLRRMGEFSGSRLTVAFSGGRDSLALAAALAHIAPVLKAELLLVHVDHRLRPGSAEDATACAALASKLELSIEVVALDPGLDDRRIGIGLEEAARRERYLALAKSAAGWGSTTLLLGHQANDQAETVLMHLFRGSGLDGMGGMREQEVRQIPWWSNTPLLSFEVNIVRPLLAETRDSIEQYVAEIGLQPIDDESNASDDFERNWVRHQVLPPILERWPSAVETIQRSADAINLDRRFLEKAADEEFDDVCMSDKTLCTDTLLSLDRSIAFRVIRRWLGELGLEEVNFDVIARIYELALNDDERRLIEVGADHKAVLAGGRLMTFDDLLSRAFDELPMSLGTRSRSWEVQLLHEISGNDVTLQVPEDVNVHIRTISEGDRWHGSGRSVMEDLRVHGIHPLIRTKLLSVAAEDGVLLIPAIYPTIRSVGHDVSGKKVGVRWSKRS